MCTNVYINMAILRGWNEKKDFLISKAVERILRPDAEYSM